MTRDSEYSISAEITTDGRDFTCIHIPSSCVPSCTSKEQCILPLRKSSLLPLLLPLLRDPSLLIYISAVGMVAKLRKGWRLDHVYWIASGITRCLDFKYLHWCRDSWYNLWNEMMDAWLFSESLWHLQASSVEASVARGVREKTILSLMSYEVTILSFLCWRFCNNVRMSIARPSSSYLSTDDCRWLVTSCQ